LPSSYETTTKVPFPLLTLSELGSLTEVVMGCERGTTFRYYPAGTDTDKPMTFVLRAITHDGGNLRLDSDGEVRRNSQDLWIGVSRDLLITTL
jgi:hypothetical protein